MAVDQKLPSKENALFRSIVRFYETKQHKKGLKAADQILKKFPDHGETLAMRGLILNSMDKKEEAMECVRKGLRNDLKSHVCWHVYGLLYRGDRNYLEAVKCYRNALRIDPENQRILNDMCLLQLQMRDLRGHSETRRLNLTLKPKNRNSWIAFAVSHQLVGNFDMAISIVDAYIRTLESDRTPTYEDSEMMLYRNGLVEEKGDLEETLSDLETNEHWMVDKLSYRVKRANLQLRLGRFEEAEESYRELLKINPDDLSYHLGLQSSVLHKKVDTNTDRKGWSKGIHIPQYKEDEVARLSSLYSILRRESPKEISFARIPLFFLVGDELKAALDRFLRRQLRKEVPALGSDLKFLYGDGHKVEVLEQLLLSYLGSLREHKRFPELFQVENGEHEEDAVEEEAESTLLWLKYLLAQHYDRKGDVELALQYIDSCLSDSPSPSPSLGPDLLHRRGRILKHAGDLRAAAAAVEQGRQMDLQDRYINNKATKYLLRCDQVAEAEKVIALFAKHEGNPQRYLFDMQCMWYELEVGHAFLRQAKNCGTRDARRKMLGRALKKFLAVEKHFQDIEEDQFDFHSYCIRKMTLRSYVEMLHMEDEIYGHPFFTRAARAAVSSYLLLLDLPEASEADEEELSLDSLSAAERKKAKAKLRKEAAKKRREEEQRQKEREQRERAEARNDNKAAKDGNKRQRGKGREQAVDPDPEGRKLLEADPRQEAWRLVTVLQRYAPQELSTHLCAFDVARRRNKILLCLQALLRAHKLAPSDRDVRQRIVLFAQMVAQSNEQQAQAQQQQQQQQVKEAEEAEAGELPPLVRDLVQAKLAFLLDQQSPEAFVQAQLKQAREADADQGSEADLELLAGAMKTLTLLEPARKQEVAAELADRACKTVQHLRQQQQELRQQQQEQLQLLQPQQQQQQQQQPQGLTDDGTSSRQLLRGAVEVHRIIANDLEQPEAAQRFFAQMQQQFLRSNHFGKGQQESPRYCEPAQSQTDTGNDQAA